MLTVALALVALPAGVFAFATTQRQMSLPVTVAMHRQYFEVGKRGCEATIKKAQAQVQPQGGEGQLLGFRFAIGASGHPKEFRRDVSAGCQAASA